MLEAVLNEKTWYAIGKNNVYIQKSGGDNMGISYANKITEEKVNVIRAAVGFRRIQPEQLKASLEGSAFIIAAYDQNRAGVFRLMSGHGTIRIKYLKPLDFKFRHLSNAVYPCISA